MMDEDTPCLLVCSPALADELGVCETSAVICGLLSKDEAYIVSVDEFFQWLREEERAFKS